MFYYVNTVNKKTWLLYDSSDGTCGDVSSDDLRSALGTGVKVTGLEIVNGNIQPKRSPIEMAVFKGAVIETSKFVAICRGDTFESYSDGEIHKSKDLRYWSDGRMYEFVLKETEGSGHIYLTTCSDTESKVIIDIAKGGIYDYFMLPCAYEVLICNIHGGYQSVFIDEIDVGCTKMMSRQKFMKYVSSSKCRKLR